MIRAIGCAAVAMLALGGCKPAGPVPDKPKPGLWEITQTITPLGGVPGAKPQTATSKACLKASDMNFTELTQQAATGCATSDVSKEPGRIHAKVICRAGQPNANQAVVDGNTTAVTLHVEVNSKESRLAPGAALPVEMQLKISMDGKRVGDCQGV